MIPDGLKKMFGLNDAKDINMANNIWKMLDEMSQSDPDAYKKFIQKNISQGLGDAKAEKQKRQKKYRIKPKQHVLLEMDANLAEKVLVQQPKINEKLDFSKEKWTDLKAQFPTKTRIFLNICSSPRVKVPTRKPNNTPVTEFQIGMLKSIECLYYSLQGPVKQQSTKNKGQQIMYYCMIFNEQFLMAFDRVANGRKILLSLAVSYFQERLENDRNPLLKKYNPNQHQKVAFYSIQKITIQFSSLKYKYGKQLTPGQFLLQAQVDTKAREDQKLSKQKQLNKDTKVKQQKQSESKPILQESKQKNPFIIVPRQQKKQQELTTLLPVKPQNHTKNNLIQVIQENNQQPISNKIPYEIKQTQQGYHIQFLVHGITNISNLDLQVTQRLIRLKTLGSQPEKQIEIKLTRPIDTNKVKAKMKKKSHILNVSLEYKN